MKKSRSIPSPSRVKRAGQSCTWESREDLPFMNVEVPLPLKRIKLETQSSEPKIKRLKLECTNPKMKLEDGTKSSQVHVIFCIDQSGSMKQRDVASESGKYVTRWNAVFECAKEFVDQQQQLCIDTQTSLQFSLILWSTNANLIFERVLPEAAQMNLERARTQNRPKGETMFSVAFKKAAEISDVKDNVLLMFLSDGRPGDLESVPPPCGRPIQAEYRFYGRTYPSAGVEIQRLKEAVSRVELHFVGIYKDGFPWLRRLASHYDGVFHETELKLEADAEIIRCDSRSGHTFVEDVSPSSSLDNSDLGNCAMRSPQLPASVCATMTSTFSSGMRSTFHSISQSLTSMRIEVGRARERQVILETGTGAASEEVTFTGVVKMQMQGGNFKPARSEKDVPAGRTVLLRVQPFAQGGIRNVYKMTEISSGDQLRTALVAKESRYEVPFKQRLAFHIETSKCQTRAAELAATFNEIAQALGLPCVHFIKTEVYRLRDPAYASGFRYLAVEPELSGQYIKFNSNNGYVASATSSNSLGSLEHEIPQAFSHFTYDHSQGLEIVVDIQGVGFRYTDPQLHSVSGIYGRGDRKKEGMEDFFRTHVCGPSCRALGLRFSESKIKKEEQRNRVKIKKEETYVNEIKQEQTSTVNPWPWR